jgi:hypothetical protein
MRQSMIYELRSKTIEFALSNRETCHHWIDYEIYDCLSSGLKSKYIEQFDMPRIVHAKSKDEEKFKLKILCRANNKDKSLIMICDCSKKYKKTLKQLVKSFKIEPYVDKYL